MDMLDIRILAILQNNGDLTNAELAEEVASTPSTCLRRVEQLKRSGHLTRCVYLVDPAKLERGLRVFMVVSTTNHNQRKRTAFANKLQKENSIVCAYGVAGEGDAILVGQFANMEEYQSTFDRLFDDRDDLCRCTSYFVSETYKESTAISCDALAETLQSR